MNISLNTQQQFLHFYNLLFCTAVFENPYNFSILLISIFNEVKVPKDFYFTML